MKTSFLIRSTALLAAAFLSPAAGQQPAPTREELANNPPLFIRLASQQLKWEVPVEPFRIAGPIYFVGTKGLSSFLITTTDGHLLLDTGMPGSGPLHEASIRKLGFKPEDIKILLTNHGHSDHAGGHAYLKRLSGAQVAALGQEQELLESGGKTDFHYARYKEFAFEPVRVDKVLQDGDIIKLADITIKVLHTPGHTRGAMTFVFDIIHEGKTYKVVIPNGVSINPGYRLVVNPSYPGIADDYRRSLSVYDSLKPDIWLGAHTETYDLAGKQARAATEGVKAWVDPEGYQRWAADERTRVESAIKKETESAPKTN